MKHDRIHRKIKKSWFYLTDTCYELGHTWCPSCTRSTIGIFVTCVTEALKIYAPLYLISDMLSRRGLRAFITRTVPYIIRSSIFLGINGGGFIAFICLLRKLTGRFYLYSSAYVPALVASLLAILWERKSRRGMLMTYVCSIALETLYRMLRFRSYVPSVPYGEVFIFLVWPRSKYLHDAVGAILSLLFTPRIPGAEQLLKRLSMVQPKGWKVAVTKIALVSVWSFTIGYVLQAVVGSLSSWSKLMKEPRKIKNYLISAYNLKFALFLATFAGGYKAMNSILHALPISRNVRILLAATVAGLSMGTIRSTTIALYALTKAIDVVYCDAAKRGLVWRWYYGDVVLYSIATALIFHCMFFETHNVRPAYIDFLDRLTGRRILEINYVRLDAFGTQASRWCTERKERLKLQT
ncbi:hypothetical protein EMCRGX_G034469 [Ephydatia muelleri]